jgi:hypothetical protein
MIDQEVSEPILLRNCSKIIAFFLAKPACLGSVLASIWVRHTTLMFPPRLVPYSFHYPNQRSGETALTTLGVDCHYCCGIDIFFTTFWWKFTAFPLARGTLGLVCRSYFDKVGKNLQPFNVSQSSEI